jgi:hypothetical protein
MIDTLIKRVSVTYVHVMKCTHIGEKGATGRVLRSSRNGRHLINYRHCLRSLPNRH